MFSVKPEREIFMTEKDSIQNLERQAANTKRLLDRLNRAAYGLTFDELILVIGNGKERNQSETENQREITDSDG